MGPPYRVILFLAILFGFSAVVSIWQARRRKERIYYVGAIVVFLMLSVFALALLNQPLLAFIVLIVTGIVSAVALPKMMTIQRREMSEQLEKQLREVDFTAALKGREFLTWKGWLKVARKWGVWKATAIYSLLSMVFIAVVLSTILSMLDLMNPWYIIGFTIASTIFSSVWFYRQINKALKEVNIAKA